MLINKWRDDINFIGNVLNILGRDITWWWEVEVQSSKSASEKVSKFVVFFTSKCFEILFEKKKVQNSLSFDQNLKIISIFEPKLKFKTLWFQLNIRTDKISCDLNLNLNLVNWTQIEVQKFIYLNWRIM